MADKPKSIASLEVEIVEATIAYESARAEGQAARKRETAALNRLNNAQKEFAKAVDELRSIAPVGSDWRTSKDRGRDEIPQSQF